MNNFFQIRREKIGEKVIGKGYAIKKEGKGEHEKKN